MEIKETREAWEKSTDDMNVFHVAVAVEKLLAFVIPVSECLELVSLEMFADGDYKSKDTVFLSSLSDIFQYSATQYKSL